jgi:hypothetical protein
MTNFSEELGRLIDEWLTERGDDRESIISALELQLMAQREELAHENC